MVQKKKESKENVRDKAKEKKFKKIEKEMEEVKGEKKLKKSTKKTSVTKESKETLIDEKKPEKKTEPKKEKKDEKKKTTTRYFRYINHLVLTEKGIDNINLKNTLVFIVDRKSTKPQIKREIERIFEVKVEKVNTLIDRKGRKKAYVKLSPEYNAVDIATQLGMM